MKDTPSISSAGEPPQEKTTQEVDKAYKKKNACAQRLTLISLSYERPYLVLDPNSIMIMHFLNLCNPEVYTCKLAVYT